MSSRAEHDREQAAITRRWMQSEARRLKMASKEPAIKAIRKVNREAEAAFKKTKQYRLEQLYEKQTFWTRRETIARNKLEDVRCEIEKLADELALQVDGRIA